MVVSVSESHRKVGEVWARKVNKNEPPFKRR